MSGLFRSVKVKSFCQVMLGYFTLGQVISSKSYYVTLCQVGSGYIWLCQVSSF